MNPKQEKRLSKIIKKALKNSPLMRDDDRMLIAELWWRQIRHDESLSAKEFLQRLSIGEFAMPETITRHRRKIQEANPKLRGSRWAERHRKASDVQENLRKYTVDDTQIFT